MTDDIDLTVVVPFGEEEKLATYLLQYYKSRHNAPLSFVVEARILLLVNEMGIEIDLSVGGMPFEERLLNRSSKWMIDDQSITTCSAEDLIILKAFAARPQDWIDIQNVITRQGKKLDRTLAIQELEPLAELKEEPEIVSQLQSLFASSRC